MKGYTNIEAIENYLLYTIDEDFKPQVEEWIEAMENHIEKETGRVFIADTEDSVKKYDGDGERWLIIDDCIEVKSVKVDKREMDDWVAYPLNTLPTTVLRMEYDYFTKGMANIEVKAKWGYSAEVPEDIAFVCTVLVAGIINQSLSHEGEISSVSMGRYSVSYKDEKQLKDFENIKSILANYKRYF